MSRREAEPCIQFEKNEDGMWEIVHPIDDDKREEEISYGKRLPDRGARKDLRNKNRPGRSAGRRGG